MGEVDEVAGLLADLERTLGELERIQKVLAAQAAALAAAAGGRAGGGGPQDRPPLCRCGPGCGTVYRLHHLVVEKASTPGLTGPARALSIRAHNDIEAARAAGREHDDVVWVSPAEILAKRTVPIPEPVAHALRTAAVVTVEVSSTAVEAGLSRPGDHQHRLPCLASSAIH